MIKEAVLTPLSHTMREIGSQLLILRRGSMEISIKGAFQDIVTSGDRLSEEWLVRTIRTVCPEDSIRGEEGAAFKGRNEYEWVLDPVDGTVVFAGGLQHFGISAGRLARGRPELGLVFLPAKDELFAAVRGKGATLNGAGLQVNSQAKHLKDCILDLAVPVHSYAGQTAGKIYDKLASVARCVFMFASVTGGMAELLKGNLDIYLHWGATPFDLAAVSCIAEESGCLVNYGLNNEAPDFSRPKIPFVVVRSRDVWDQLRPVLLELDPFPRP